MIEPTETESKETLDAFAETLFRITEEDPETAARRPAHHADQPARRGPAPPVTLVLKWTPGTPTRASGSSRHRRPTAMICRVLPFEVADGPANMALDEALLDAVAADPTPAVLPDLRLVGPDAEPGLFPEGGRRRGRPPLAGGPDRPPADRRRGDLAPSRGDLRAGRPRRPPPGPARRRPLPRRPRGHRRGPAARRGRGRSPGSVAAAVHRRIVRFCALPTAIPRISCPRGPRSSAAPSDGAGRGAPARLGAPGTLGRRPRTPGRGRPGRRPDGRRILVEPAAREPPRGPRTRRPTGDVSGAARDRAEVLRREVYARPVLDPTTLSPRRCPHNDSTADGIPPMVKLLGPASGALDSAGIGLECLMGTAGSSPSPRRFRRDQLRATIPRSIAGPPAIPSRSDRNSSMSILRDVDARGILDLRRPSGS